MKILYHHRIRSKDGQHVHIDELTSALKRRGHEIVMVGPPAFDADEFGADGGLVDWLKRNLPKVVYELLECVYNIVAARRLSAAIALHQPDVIYERYNLFNFAGVWIRSRTGLPFLLEVNAPLADERARFGGLGLPLLARWIEARTWRGADMVLPVTGVLADRVHAEGVPRDRLVVIPNGIDPERFPADVDSRAAKHRLGIDGRLVLGFTGFMRPWHGLDRVVRFIAESAPALRLHFLVVGDGPARAEVSALAETLGISDQVTFAGLVPRDQVAGYVAAFDIALQPDVVPYASPLKLFEYMALGRAIIAPSSTNIREILTDGENALLFDPETPESFRMAMARLCADSALRERLGAAARLAIDDQRLTWDANAERVEALFLKLLAAQKVAGSVVAAAQP